MMSDKTQESDDSKENHEEEHEEHDRKELREKNFDELDEKVELLIEEGGLSVADACHAMGISRSAFLNRRKKKEAQNTPRVLNIEYNDSTRDDKNSKQVIIMIGNSDAIMSLLKAAERVES